MYVYKQTEANEWGNLYTVGFYSPDGEWHGDSDHEDREEAAKRVRFLNGGEMVEYLNDDCASCKADAKFNGNDINCKRCPTKELLAKLRLTMGKHGEPWRVVSRVKTKRDFYSHMTSEQEYTVWDVMEGDQVVFTCYSEEIANRIVLCVNACEGMSDEEMRDIQDFMFGRKPEYTKQVLALKADLSELQDKFDNQADVIEKWYPEHAAYITLKADLAEAGKHLRHVISKFHPRFHSKETKNAIDFLTRTGGK